MALKCEDSKKEKKERVLGFVGNEKCSVYLDGQERAEREFCFSILITRHLSSQKKKDLFLKFLSFFLSKSKYGVIL